MGTSVADWSATRSEVDTHPMEGVEPVETPPAVTPPTVETPPTETPPVDGAPVPATAPEAVIAALVKSGMAEDQAKAMVAGLSPAPTKQEVQEQIEAFLDGKPHPIPKNLTFKIKSGSLVQEKTAEQLQKEGMLFADYQKGTKQLAQERRDHARMVAEWTARDAALKERQRWFEEQRNEMLQAQKDPAKWEEYQEVLRLRAQNPAFDKLYQDAMKAREDGAMRGVFEKAIEQQEVRGGVEQALEWIEGIGREYPGVDPERVRVMYAQELSGGKMSDNSEANVRQIYQREMDYLKSGPASKEAEELRARIAALEESAKADTHNAKTARVLERAKAPNTAPVGGAPAAPVIVQERKPIVGRQNIEDRISEWSKVRE